MCTKHLPFDTAEMWALEDATHLTQKQILHIYKNFLEVLDVEKEVGTLGGRIGKVWRGSGKNGENGEPMGCEGCCYKKWHEHIHPHSKDDTKDWRSSIADSKMLKRIPELAVNPFRDQFIRVFSELHRVGARGHELL